MPELFRPEGGIGKVVDVLGRNIAITGLAEDADIVRLVRILCCLIKQFLEIRMVITVQSLEQKRSWKREQSAAHTEAIAHEMRIEVEHDWAGTPTISSGFPRWFPWNKLSCSTAMQRSCLPIDFEPFGIINLEAMACGTPVVAAAESGIPEVVVHGQTGNLVPFEPASSAEAEPVRPEQYAQDLAAAINELRLLEKRNDSLMYFAVRK